MDQSKQLRRRPTIIELRAKALFFGVEAMRSSFGDDHPWCAVYIADKITGMARSGHWHSTEYEALEEYLEHQKIHGYPDR